MKSQLLEKVSPHLDGKLATYATLAGAALAASALAPNADATIIWSGPVSINIPSSTQGVYLNVVTGATTTGGSSGLASWDVNPWSSWGWVSSIHPLRPVAFMLQRLQAELSPGI